MTKKSIKSTFTHSLISHSVSFTEKQRPVVSTSMPAYGVLWIKPAFFLLQTQTLAFMVSSDHMTLSKSSTLKWCVVNLRWVWTCTSLGRGTFEALQDLTPNDVVCDCSNLCLWFQVSSDHCTSTGPSLVAVLRCKIFSLVFIWQFFDLWWRGCILPTYGC